MTRPSPSTPSLKATLHNRATQSGYTIRVLGPLFDLLSQLLCQPQPPLAMIRPQRAFSRHPPPQPPPRLARSSLDTQPRLPCPRPDPLVPPACHRQLRWRLYLPPTIPGQHRCPSTTEPWQMPPTADMEGSGLCAEDEGVWTAGKPCVSQGEPSQSSSGQPCS